MNRKTLALLQLVSCSALWSIAGIIMKLIPWSGFAIASMRSLIAGAVAYIYLRMSGMQLAVGKKTVLSGVSLGMTLTLFCVANKLTTAANAIVLQFTAPVFVVIFSAAFLGKRFKRADIAAVVLTFAGISLFFVDQLGTGGTRGNIAALCAGAFFGAYYVCLGSSDERERLSSVIFGNAFTFLAGLPFIFAAPPEVTGRSVMLILVLGVFQLGIPYVLLAKGSGECPPLVCSLLGAVEPLLNPVWVMLFDGETPGPFALAGGAIVIVTITVWCALGGRRERQEASAG